MVHFTSFLCLFVDPIVGDGARHVSSHYCGIFRFFTSKEARYSLLQ